MFLKDEMQRGDQKLKKKREEAVSFQKRILLLFIYIIIQYKVKVKTKEKQEKKRKEKKKRKKFRHCQTNKNNQKSVNVPFGWWYTKARQ